MQELLRACCKHTTENSDYRNKKKISKYINSTNDKTNDSTFDGIHREIVNNIKTHYIVVRFCIAIVTVSAAITIIFSTNMYDAVKSYSLLSFLRPSGHS